jgi:hypothetical protein
MKRWQLSSQMGLHSVPFVSVSSCAKTSKSEKLAELKTPIDPEAWHTITIEIV